MKVMFFALLAAGFCASNCLAGVDPVEIFPGLWEKDGTGTDAQAGGVFFGDERFPDTAFVVAEHSTAGQHVCTIDASPYGSGAFAGGMIADMDVDFVTKDPGLAHVSFCGTLDVDNEPGTIWLAAKIDDADDCISIRGVNPWGVEGGSEGNSGPICWEWICKVTNDEGRGNRPMRTEHSVTVHCASADYRAKFNDRSTFVDYTYIHSN